MSGNTFKTRLNRLIELNPILAHWTRKDLLFFYVFVPSFLAAIYLLPLELKESLRLVPSNPSMISIFLSHYTHLSFEHFFGNLLVYLAVVFSIFNIETGKKVFYLTSLSLFILLPIIASLSNIYFTPYVPPVSGFSAVGSGFIGYLLYAAYTFLRNNSTARIKGDFLTMLFLLNLSIVGIFNLSTPVSVKLILAVVSIVFLYKNAAPIAETSRQYTSALRRILPKMPRVAIYRSLIFMEVSISLFLLPSLIPAVIVEGNSLVNTFAHYVGYCFGVVAPLLIENISHIRETAEETFWEASR